MKKFTECREEVIQEAVGMTWEHFLANYRLIDGSLIDVYSERAAEAYAKQFVKPEPTHDEIILSCMNYQLSQDAEDELPALEIWIEAIDWYKIKKATD